MTGEKMHALAKTLWPICRSLTGNGVRDTFKVIQQILPELTVYEVPTGQKCFDWTVPKEWNINTAYIKDSKGNLVVDFNQSNLHVVGYSTPINQKMSLDELSGHIHTLKDQPNAIPYITSYYSPYWGFCMTHDAFEQLQPDTYEVMIDSTLEDGSMSYGELIIKGESDEEVFLSTYVCHPSMANNELSGPCVATYLAKWLMSQSHLKYTYRIVFIPENIGSIYYLSKHLDHLKEKVIAGFNISCIGDDRAYSFIPSRNEATLSDQVAKHVLSHLAPDYITYPFAESGSDERRYCSPGVDLPIASILRSKYNCYPEYHTSLDDLNFVTPTGLEGGFNVLKKAIEVIEKVNTFELTLLCEPQLGKRGLYPSLSTKETNAIVSNMLNFISYCDGKLSTVEIAEKLNLPVWEFDNIIKNLAEQDIIRERKN